VENNLYENIEKQKIRDCIFSLLKDKEEEIVILESPKCLMLKQLLEKGYKNIKIPNNEEYHLINEFKEYFVPFSLGSFLGNFNLEKKIGLVWADFCGTWESHKEEIVPLFHRELLKDNSLLVSSCSLRTYDGRNDFISSLITYLT